MTHKKRMSRTSENGSILLPTTSDNERNSPVLPPATKKSPTNHEVLQPPSILSSITNPLYKGISIPKDVRNSFPMGLISAIASGPSSPMEPPQTLAEGSSSPVTTLATDIYGDLNHTQVRTQTSILGRQPTDGSDHLGLTALAQPQDSQVSPSNLMKTHRGPAIIWPTHIFQPNITTNLSVQLPDNINPPLSAQLNISQPIPHPSSQPNIQPANFTITQPPKPILNKPSTQHNPSAQLTQASAPIKNGPISLKKPTAPKPSEHILHGPNTHQLQPPAIQPDQPNIPANHSTDQPGPRPDHPPRQSAPVNTTNVRHGSENPAAPNPTHRLVSYAQILNNQHVTGQHTGIQQSGTALKSFNFDGAKVCPFGSNDRRRGYDIPTGR